MRDREPGTSGDLLRVVRGQRFAEARAGLRAQGRVGRPSSVQRPAHQPEHQRVLLPGPHGEPLVGRASSNGESGPDVDELAAGLTQGSEPAGVLDGRSPVLEQIGADRQEHPSRSDVDNRLSIDPEGPTGALADPGWLHRIERHDLGRLLAKCDDPATKQ